MKKLLFLSACLLLGAAAFSQKVYFVYIQSEPREPFYLKLQERIYSSSASGYLILSKLHDSSYRFKIGFPDNRVAEMEFSVTVAKKDHGYLLKNFGEKGWGLYDLQTLLIQYPAGGARADAAPKTENKDVSVFTDILSKAADDPSLKDRTVTPEKEEKKTETVKTESVIQPEEKKPESEPVVIKKAEPDTGTVVIQKEVKDPGKPEPAEIKPAVLVEKEKPAETAVIKEEQKEAAPEEYKMSVVTRRSESSTTEGFGLVFTDDNGPAGVDTIRLLIPNPRPAVEPIKEAPKEEKKFLDITVADTVKTTEIKTVETSPRVTDSVKTETVIKDTVAVKTVTGVNCPAQAEETDFFSLRKKMVAEDGDDNMISVARAYFKTKCFSTLQVKNLSTLFLNDEGKYKFFDAAYNYVYDAANFPSLQAELKDVYYVNRFKAMLR